MGIPENHTYNPFINAIEILKRPLHGQDREFCNARELHAALYVNKPLGDWLLGRIQEYGFVDGEDFRSISSKDPDGRGFTEYELTLDMARGLALLESTEVGRQVRQYFIQVERHIKSELTDRAQAGA
jgi:anti-repressor protein